jgi:cyclopropane fatty-acyl-phospholipid synthase-like methyltransferase
MGIKEELAASFDVQYSGSPPWEIGAPQPAFIEAEERGLIGNSVLDVGCGTGDLSCYLAGRGHSVTAVDFSPAAISLAKSKAAGRALQIDFRVHDALLLRSLQLSFHTAVDSGLFHVFSDRARAHYAEALSEVIQPGGRLLMICFGDREPGEWGPRRVSELEIRSTFSDGWSIRSITPSHFLTNDHRSPVQALFSVITRS